MENIYKEYLEGRTLEECVNNLVEIFKEEGEEKDFDAAEEIYQWELVKEKVYPMLITRNGNKKYLSTLVHRPFLNLEIIYYIEVEVKGGKGNIKVTNVLNRRWGCSEEELYSSAMANLENAGYELVGIGRLIEDITGLTMEEENDSFIYVLLNENRHYGAAGILSQKVLQMCGEKVQGNFYLLPSSIHEMIVVPDVGKITAEELRKLVAEVNQEHVLPGERLSDEVFYYDLEKQEVQIAG